MHIWKNSFAWYYHSMYMPTYGISTLIVYQKFIGFVNNLSISGKKGIFSDLCPFTFGIFFILEHLIPTDNYHVKMSLICIWWELKRKKSPLQSPCSQFTSRMPLLSRTTWMHFSIEIEVRYYKLFSHDYKDCIQCRNVSTVLAKSQNPYPIFIC